MTRMSLISVVYCSLETPARSAAPYTHQWHTKPNILGLNSRPVLIRSHLFILVSGYWMLDAGCWFLDTGWNKEFFFIFLSHIKSHLTDDALNLCSQVLIPAKDGISALLKPAYSIKYQVSIIYLHISNCRIKLLYDLFLWNCRVNLVQKLFIGKVL